MGESVPLFELKTLWEIRETPPPPPPEALSRTDGANLFYAGKVNILFGDSESGKTWLALHACVEEIRKGNNVVFLDFEDHADAILERVRSLGAEEDVLKRFYYVRVEEPITKEVKALILPFLKEISPTMVVFDSFDEVLQLHDHDTYNPKDVRRLASELFDPMTRLGAAVVVIDHVTHSNKHRQGGSQAKLSRVDGTSFKVHRQVPFARGGHEPGKVQLYVKKDRPGHVRKVSVKTGTGTDRLSAECDFETFEEDSIRIIVNPPAKSSATGMKDRTDRVLDLVPFITDEPVSRAQLAKNFRAAGGSMGGTYIKLSVDQGLAEGRWFETKDGLVRNPDFYSGDDPAEELDEL